jgi:hypothetical protein
MAIDKLMSPDKYSRTPDHEGRRIEKIDGGWELLNHSKYRLMASKEDAKSANAARQRRHRKRNATVTDSNATVTPSNAIVTEGRDIAEAEAKVKADQDKPILSPPALASFEAKELFRLRINNLYNRRSTTKWSDKETRAFNKLQIEEEDMIIIEKYCHQDSGCEYRRKDIQTLLNNWNGEVDRARAWGGNKNTNYKVEENTNPTSNLIPQR